VAAEGQAAPSAAAPEAAEAAGPAPERAARGAAIDDPRARANAVYREGVRAYRAGDLRRALELFQQVLDIDQAVEGHRASAIWNIGRIHQDMGNDRAALTMYRTYLAQPSVPDERRTVAQRIVADLERELGPGGTPTPEAAPEEGGAGKEPPAESLPTMPQQRAQALYGLASQAYQSGDFATALEHFQQLMRTDGLEQRLYTETLYNMGQCYRRMGNSGAAIDMFRGFLQQPDATPEERQRAQQLIAMLQH
jgi:tetratricopeptide (TPR) repeat protein